MEFLAQMVQFWQTFQAKVRSSLPSACLDALNMSKPNEPGGGEHEMSQYTSDPSNANGQPVQAVWDEATGQFIAVPAPPPPEMDAEFGGDGKLTEWQAGWNVTNAIQVSCLIYSPPQVVTIVRFRECSS